MLEGIEVVMAVGVLLKEFFGDILFLAKMIANLLDPFNPVGKAVDFQSVAGVEHKALADAFLFA
jgi:hypothetical protein